MTHLVLASTASLRLGLIIMFALIAAMVPSTLSQAAEGESAWELVSVATAPSPRFSHGMAYDEAGERIVLFGGAGASGCNPLLGDTWVFDGAN